MRAVCRETTPYEHTQQTANSRLPLRMLHATRMQSSKVDNPRLQSHPIACRLQGLHLICLECRHGHPLASVAELATVGGSSMTSGAGSGRVKLAMPPQRMDQRDSLHAAADGTDKDVEVNDGILGPLHAEHISCSMAGSSTVPVLACFPHLSLAIGTPLVIRQAQQLLQALLKFLSLFCS